MKLVNDKSKAHKWWSMRLMAAAAVFEGLRAIVPIWGGFLPPVWAEGVTAVLITAAMLARLVKQEVLSAEVD